MWNRKTSPFGLHSVQSGGASKLRRVKSNQGLLKGRRVALLHRPLSPFTLSRVSGLEGKGIEMFWWDTVARIFYCTMSQCWKDLEKIAGQIFYNTCPEYGISLSLNSRQQTTWLQRIWYSIHAPQEKELLSHTKRQSKAKHFINILIRISIILTLWKKWWTSRKHEYYHNINLNH